ncbi:MAG: peptidoglycan DD-metalloendopeptidase family protein [Oscillospiraceae bacterium]|nr:peptidoglycan DD-metalloendopeptidase family protein [Oscillospiraceae bacterium]
MFVKRQSGSTLSPVRGSNFEFDFALLRKINGEIARFLYKMGTVSGNYTLGSFSSIAKTAKGFYRRVLRVPLRFIKSKIDTAAVAIKERNDKIVYPFERFGYGAGIIKSGVLQAIEKGENPIGAFFVSLASGIRNNKKAIFRSFATVFNYVIPVACIAAFVFLVQTVAGLTFAVNVNFLGKNVGFIASETDFDSANRILEQRMIYVDDDEVLDAEPQFKLTVVESNDVLSPNELVDEILKRSDHAIGKAYGLFVDGVFYGAVVNEEAITMPLDTLLEWALEENEDAEVEFLNEVDWIEGLYLNSSIVESDQEIVDLILSDVSGEQLHTVVSGDTPMSIAEKYSMEYNDLKALNPDIVERMMAGTAEKVVISNSQPFITVKAVKLMEYTEIVSFERETINDSTRMSGYSQVTRQGVNGENKIIARVEFVNGVETGRTIEERIPIKAAISERTVIGTRLPAPSANPANSASSRPNSTGPVGSNTINGMSFMFPVGNYKTTTTRFRGGHRGVDLIAPAGSPIYAAAPGTVVLSSYYSSYGRCVIIDHGGGVRTVYAHASALYVNVGDRVERGQHIAAVGTTGRSSGNHLHFEIQHNGRLLNPDLYIR